MFWWASTRFLYLIACDGAHFGPWIFFPDQTLLTSCHSSKKPPLRGNNPANTLLGDRRQRKSISLMSDGRCVPIVHVAPVSVSEVAMPLSGLKSPDHMDDDATQAPRAC